MAICPTCQAELGPNARFCPKDGTTLRPDSLLVAVGQVDVPTAATVAVKTGARRKPPSANDDPLIGRILDGRWRILGTLGAGGVGAVYQGEHVQMKKTVALKVLHSMFASTEEFRKRFEREARSASQLSHPACVQVLDFGRVEKIERDLDGKRAPDEELTAKLSGMPYLVMELVRGTLLADRMYDGPPLSPAEAVQVTLGVLGALKHAHGLGIVHRDIKPGNIMLTAPDAGGMQVKLLDFGLAKQLGGEGMEQPLTQAGMVFGTPGYLSPEQAAGLPADERADLYSLGVVLFEMACGRRPFVHEDPLDAVRDHLHTPPPEPRSINPLLSAKLEAAILKALAKDPKARFESAAAFAGALESCPEGGGKKEAAAKPAGASAPTASGPLARLPRQLRLLGREIPTVVAAGGLAVVVVLAIAIGSAGHKAPAPAPRPAPLPPPPHAAIEPPSPSAWHHLDLAVSYQKRLWCSDAVEELSRALRDAPTLARDPRVAATAIACLGPKTYDKAARFLVEDLGEQARAPLEAAAEGSPSLEVRRAAGRVLEQLGR